MKLLQINTIRNLICIFLGLVFFASGMSKLYFEHQFVEIIGPVWLEKELTQYGLGMYARFIGYSQVCVGFLLFTLRYSTLGAVMLIPLVGNIFMVTVSMNWKGTPYAYVVTGIPFEQPLRKQSFKGVSA